MAHLAIRTVEQQKQFSKKNKKGNIIIILIGVCGLTLQDCVKGKGTCLVWKDLTVDSGEPKTDK